MLKNNYLKDKNVNSSEKIFDKYIRYYCLIFLTISFSSTIDRLNGIKLYTEMLKWGIET